METINGLPNHRWGGILHDIGVGESQQTQDDASSSLSENRGNLYVPSSPIRASDNDQCVFIPKADFSLTRIPDEFDILRIRIKMWVRVLCFARTIFL